MQSITKQSICSIPLLIVYLFLYIRWCFSFCWWCWQHVLHSLKVYTYIYILYYFILYYVTIHRQDQKRGQWARWHLQKCHDSFLFRRSSRGVIKHVDKINNFVIVVHEIELQIQVYKQTLFFFNCLFIRLGRCAYVVPHTTFFWLLDFSKKYSAQSLKNIYI